MDEFRQLAPGLYETIIDAGLQSALEHYGERAVQHAVDTPDFPYVVSKYVAGRVQDALAQSDDAEKFELTDRILQVLDDFGGRNAEPQAAQNRSDAAYARGLVVQGNAAQMLTEIKNSPKVPALVRPETPLNDAALLTNAEHDPSIQAELAKELPSAQRVDALIAFIKWTGIRTIATELADLRARGVPLRIITTTYTGATERRALDRLVREFGAQVKISYRTRSTRLHAKAWLIHRNTGFHTAFVGSSNLSAAAMQDGLEWNVRLARASTPSVFAKFETTFNSYWESPAFETYDPDRDAARLDAALAQARWFGKPGADGVLGLNGSEGGTAGALVGPDGQPVSALNFTALDIRPYPYQQVMLDELAYERSKGHHQNLVVAATGTGKTVVAALDYRNLRTDFEREHGRLPRTLFVAHRDEILKQSMRTFRDVVKSSKVIWSTSTGGRLADLDEGTFHRYDSIAFASIQSLHEKALGEIGRDFFDIVIIDEFHHAEARTYRRVMEHFKARELVALTATPERGDGVNVALEFFGGRVATELRLWDALEEGLLSPFHYFVSFDGTDLSGVKMRGGDYVTSELSNVLTGNDARVRMIVAAMQDKIIDPSTMRAMCFCVDINHARYMAESFRKFGFRAEYVTSRESSMPREDALHALKNGEIQIICSVDIFNEGVDVPDIDTVLMLRPTQSSTIFLQQLGRGLRLSDSKSVLTVLDFVGNQNEDFRFDLKLQALTGTSRRNLTKAVESGFGHLPAGSQIILEEKPQQVVLKSIRQSLRITTPKLPSEIRRTAESVGVGDVRDYQLTDYLHDAQRDLADIYSRGAYAGRPVSWRRLRHWAHTGSDAAADGFEDVRARLRALAHVADPERIDTYLRLVSEPNLRYDVLSAREKLYAHMLMYSFWPQGARDGEKFRSVDYALQVLRATPGLTDELTQMFRAASDRAKRLYEAPAGALGVLSPLKVGAKYSREELLAGLGQGFEFGDLVPGHVREGVKYCRRTNTDALLVTLVKSEADFSPNTLYRDYALSPTLFHWESQSRTSPESETGKRYRGLTDKPSNIALFVRERKRDDLGEGAAYTFAGPAAFKDTRGSKPMQITWELAHPLPPELYVAARAVAS
ncbi:MAG: DUF3427 domain-containing protein [Actinomycetaceae bacterium]|nr:DUF3427 domain-containing protein [Actinomycetaceae bacterium]